MAPWARGARRGRARVLGAQRLPPLRGPLARAALLGGLTGRWQDPDERTTWLANVVGTPGAHTCGRSLAEAKRHAIEVVALWFELEPDDFDIDWDIRLGNLAAPVKRARQAMAHAEEDRQRRDDAVRALTDAGVSYRDIAELLGLSHQRVAQIARAS